jgi:hypothetical protein
MISSSQHLPPPAGISHPLPNLCEMSAAEILAAYRHSQLRDVESLFGRIRNDARDLSREIAPLHRYLQAYPADSVRKRLGADTVEHLFRRMHAHVMGHPVWVHPFFVRMAQGDLSLAQLTMFARQYFNQVKNTRQCVALALGRFHTMMDRPDGELNIILSELTQVALAGLLGDEYGTASAHGCNACAPSSPDGGLAASDIGRIFAPVTHPALFRRFLDALGAAAGDHDVPMLHGVADNVLVQRILAGDPAYDELEALASVGLGMEWGVPAFFSMIMSGIHKVTSRERMVIDPASMEIWSLHVKQDVEHAMAVLLATSLHVRDPRDARRIEGATNVLMAFRYDMMSNIYRAVFGEPCETLSNTPLPPCYAFHDQRIWPLLSAARRGIRPGSVLGYADYGA